MCVCVRVVLCVYVCRMVQDDLNRLYEWSEKWQMQFNVNKCSIMSVGKGNRPVDYTLNDTTLGRSYSERDFWEFK